MYSASEYEDFSKKITLRNWDKGGSEMRFVFHSIPQMFNTAVIHRAGKVSELEYEFREDIKNYKVKSFKENDKVSFDEYISESDIDGFIILHKGKIVYEKYNRIECFEKSLLMSVTKVFASTLVAILEDKGLVDSKKPIDYYIDELKGSSWEGIKVIDILDMASGIDSVDNYYDEKEPHFRLEEILGWQVQKENTPESVYKFLASLKRKGVPGKTFEYASANTYMLAWLVERVTGYKFHDILTKELWSKIGAEGDALITVNKSGVAAAHSGMFAMLRDVARFGLLFTESWNKVSSEKIVTDNYMNKIKNLGRPEVFKDSKQAKLVSDGKHNTYQWDFVYKDNDFFKGGYGGQGLYISPDRDIVVAFSSTIQDPKLPQGVGSIYTHALLGRLRKLLGDLF